MKTWLKWGLIFAGIGIVLELIRGIFFMEFFSISAQLLFMVCFENSYCYLGIDLNLANLGVGIIFYIIDLLIIFFIGTLIGRAIDKNKEVKKKENKMKTWLKWGLIIVGIGLFIDLSFYPLILMGVMSVSCYSDSVCIFLESMFGGDRFILSYILDALVYFLIGTLIGWLIDKNKTK